MRVFVVLLLGCAAAMVYAGPAAKHRVDLDKPGAIEALKRENPEHFRRVSGILTLATEMPCHTDNFANVIRARFDAEEAKCGVLLQTSDPAKRRLSFVLGETNYVSVVKMKQTERLVPAK
jgi:hypothetical protein